MKKNLILLVLTLLIPHFLWSQNYFEITKKNVVHYDSSYLINIPLTQNSRSFYLTDPAGLIPEKVYETSAKETIIDAVNTIYVTRKYRSAYYFYQYLYDFFGEENQLQNINTKADSILIYYIESYPGYFYGEHPEYKRPLSLRDFINTFEKKNGIKIGKWFSVGVGGEGDAYDYLTLSGLTLKQKIKFIDERRKTLNRDTLNKNSLPAKIYMPSWKKLRHLMQDSINLVIWKKEEADPNMIYASVELEPKYPGGQAAFTALFNSVTFDPGVNTIITFVVMKDGTLSDVKVLRGGSERVDKKIKEIIKSGPKWIPGQQNSNNVKVQYTTIIHRHK